MTARVDPLRLANAILKVAEPNVAWGRDESEPCQRGTVGCCINHEGDEPCETW